MLTAICNQCGKQADFELVCEFEGDLGLTFLKCPECEAKYLVAVMDSDLIRDIETFASMKKKIGTEPVTELYIQDVQNLYREIVRRMKVLKDQYLNQDEE